MIFRLSQKLNAKLGAGPLAEMPVDDNPLADWSANLFTADRTQYVLVTNTLSLYSTVFFGKGIPSESHFIERALSSIREFMEADEQESVYRRFIAPASETVNFARALNRSVTGSMNDLVFHAKAWLIVDGLAPHDVGFQLNNIPFSSLRFIKPRESFEELAGWLGRSRTR